MRTAPEEPTAVAEHLEACRRSGLEREAYERIRTRLHTLGAPDATGRAAVTRLEEFVESIIDDEESGEQA